VKAPVVRAHFPIRRRRLLVGAFSGAVAGGVGQPATAAPLPDEALAFAARNFADAIAALGGVPQASTQIMLEMPQVAEDGALVPISVTSLLPGTREILIVVDGNPQPLAVRFTIPEGTEPYIATRIRMAQSGTVYAAVRTDGGLYATAHSTQVTVGGCA
jgi:sulfur-oxidizing protein SoxY